MPSAGSYGTGPLRERRNVLFAGMLASSISAFAISYSTAWSVRVASSTTYSMVGALNKLPVALSGMLFFAKERSVVNAGNIISVIIGRQADRVHRVPLILLWTSVCERHRVQRGTDPAAREKIRGSGAGDTNPPHRGDSAARHRQAITRPLIELVKSSCLLTC